MKILFNTMGLGKGGAERVINLLSNELAQNNEIMIVTNINSKIEYPFDNRITIKPLTKTNNVFTRKLRRMSLFLIYKLRNYILSFEPDVIISFLPEPSFRLLLLKKYDKKIKNIPAIVSVRNDPNTEYANKIYHSIMKWLYPIANELVLQTEDSKNYFINNINYSGIVIHNPVSDEFIIKKYNGDRNNVIVAVGRLESQKNYYNMIEAFNIVIKTHDNYTLNIYGDGYLRNKLKKHIKKLDLEKKIILKGKVNNIKDQIYKAKAFIMSSDYEGMPNSLLEAACLGVPCVSTDCPCGGPKEILDYGQAGCLVPINNSCELASGICRVIDDVEYSNKISQKANENAYKYKKDTIIKQWKSLINRVIKESMK